jgi:signal transduction histidine kinase
MPPDTTHGITPQATAQVTSPHVPGSTAAGWPRLPDGVSRFPGEPSALARSPWPAAWVEGSASDANLHGDVSSTFRHMMPLPDPLHFRQLLLRAILLPVGLLLLLAGILLWTVSGLIQAQEKARHYQVALTRLERVRLLLIKELESFSYSVSHDLRSPLRAIDGFAQALREDEGERLSPEGLRLLTRLQAAATRMGQLIDDLLQLSRVTRAESRWTSAPSPPPCSRSCASASPGVT